MSTGDLTLNGPVAINTTSGTQLTLNHTDGANSVLKMQNAGGEAWVGSNNDDLVLYSTSSGTEFFRGNSTGATFINNVGIGASANTGNALLIDENTSGSVMVVKNSTNNIFFTASGTQTIATGASGANSAIRINMDSTTNRSINASGTINASGADYAEYVRIASWILLHNESIKNNPNLTDEEQAEQHIKFKAGDIIGFDADGRVTNKFSDAVQFAVKSTNPSIVGGDIWAVTPRPEIIEPNKIEYTGIEKPKPTLDEEGNDSQDYSQYEADQAEYAQLVAEERARVDAINEANYNEWFEIHEQERTTVDRIAFCGVVPVNNAPACNAGDYLIVTDGFELVAKPEHESFADIKNSIGRVKSIGEDGRPLIIVKAG